MINLTKRLASKNYMRYRQACAVQESMMLRSYALLGVQPPSAQPVDHWLEYKGK